MTQTHSRPAGNGAAAQQVEQTTSSVTERDDLPHGRALAGPPCPGRHLWAVTVPTCPRCGGMHQHRAGQVARLLSGRLSRTCPTTGRPYVLAPVQRRREARRG